MDNKQIGKNADNSSIICKRINHIYSKTTNGFRESEGVMRIHTFTENDLASANEQAIRADERAKVIAEVESWLVNDDEILFTDAGDVKVSWVHEIRNRLRDKLRAKLAQMGGTKC